MKIKHLGEKHFLGQGGLGAGGHGEKAKECDRPSHSKRDEGCVVIKRIRETTGLSWK